MGNSCSRNRPATRQPQLPHPKAKASAKKADAEKPKEAAKSVEEQESFAEHGVVQSVESEGVKSGEQTIRTEQSGAGEEKSEASEEEQETAETERASKSQELRESIDQGGQPSTEERRGSTATMEKGTGTPRIKPTFHPSDEVEGDVEFPKNGIKGIDLTIKDTETEWVALSEGVRYRGGWKEGVQHGIGELNYGNGTGYLGQFDNGRAYGKGVFVGKDGSRYEGDFVDGRATGYGVYTFPDGTVFYGNFKEDQRHGRGKEVQPDGLTYVGDYL